ncbi:MAG: miaA [Rickettsiaceae bacterium]|jgi:tRNA dimethylallyltransferase|nr:miaA [Rickettsiaceae bacterium]
MNKILIISGATASGKSALAMQIAAEKNAVIINADSMQLYLELPILSSQPSAEDLKHSPHFLYSVLKHNENSSVGIWLEMVKRAIDNALENRQLPIVVGGTGFYISKLVDGINQIPEIDQALQNQLRQFTSEDLKKELLTLGENLLELENLDPQRLMRRLEVLKQTGKSLSWWQNQPRKTFYNQEDFSHFYIDLPRDKLYQNCDERFASMFKNGAVEEVKNLINSGLSDNSLIIKTIGFEEIRNYLNGEIDQQTAIENARQKTRNYAKRQMTWFRNQFKNKIVITNYSDWKCRLN